MKRRNFYGESRKKDCKAPNCHSNYRFFALIPSAFGYFNTRVNYDILYYLPDNIDTMKGQEILMDDFGKGAFAMEVVEGMTTKEVTDVKK